MHPVSATVHVPASTSNLGSGFDTVGLAVRLYTHVHVTRATAKAIHVRTSSSQPAGPKAHQIVNEAAKLFFQRVGLRAFGVDVALTGDVPIGRGLGASGAARVGVLAAVNELAGTKLTRQELLELATRLEGHPDNASPALFGGFTVSGMVGRSVRCCRFSVSPRVRLVTLIPRFEINTEEARRLVPRHFSKADSLHGLNRAALIVAAFASRSYCDLRGVFDDRVHQPYRERLIPPLRRVIAAGEKAGAIGGWLSGSGSAIMCLTLDRPQAVAEAMHKQLPDSEVQILSPDNRGMLVSR